MPDCSGVKSEIDRLLVSTRTRIPKKTLPPLPPDESLGGEPGWRAFEHEIWMTGEKIRQLFLKAPRLRTDGALQEQIVDIACDRRAHRGRQSFVMLLGFRCCSGHAEKLTGHLDDPFVQGHVLSTLYKMRAAGYSKMVRPLLVSRHAWIRNEAKRYLAWDVRPAARI